MYRDGGRLGHHGLVGAQGLGNRVNSRLMRDIFIAKATANSCRSRLGLVQAEERLSIRAIRARRVDFENVAIRTVEMSIHNDPVAYAETFHARANLAHNGNNFMAQPEAGDTG